MPRSEEEIKTDMLKTISDDLDKSGNHFIDNALSAAALEFTNMYIALEYLKGKFDVNNLEGEELAKFIYQRTGIERKPATYASADIVISGEKGVKISKGTLASADDVIFTTLDDAIIPDAGSVTVKVQAAEQGSQGNAAANSINQMPISTPGVIDIYNPDAATGGYDAESDNELRQRYYERVRTPATSGNKYHYLAWAKEVLGVGDAKVIPLWNGAGTVKVIIVDSNRQPATEELRQEVYEHIEEERPIGADVTVVSATAKNITIAASVNLADGYKIQEVQEEFSDRIEEYRQDIAFKDSYISYTAIGNILFSTSGVLDYNDLKLNEEMKNIALGVEEIPIFDTVGLEVI
uniref:Baseplate J like protein n=1 Tax=Siphoviridae sp. ctOb14 TaxID=2827862 RepID=A0A8S5SML9_9CAUD|nr:MAG TPA: Baseplate J like protein [Siphoviridae sp. ctOb14]